MMSGFVKLKRFVFFLKEKGAFKKMNGCKIKMTKKYFKK